MSLPALTHMNVFVSSAKSTYKQASSSADTPCFRDPAVVRHFAHDIRQENEYTYQAIQRIHMNTRIDHEIDEEDENKALNLNDQKLPRL